MKAYALFLETLQDTLNLMLIDHHHQLVDTWQRTTHQNMLETILSDIENLLQKHHLNPMMIKKLYWVSHPGLYTGMRMGSLIVKAWSTNHRTKVYALDKLHLQASSDCISLVDAKSHQFYGQVYVHNQAQGPIAVIDATQLQAWQQTYPSLPVIQDTITTFEQFQKHRSAFSKIAIKHFHLPYYKPPC